MPERKQGLSNAQIAVMNVLWDLGEATITRVAAELEKKSKVSINRNNVQMQILRLEKKGWLKRGIRERCFVFKPTCRRQEATSHLAGEFVERVFEGSAADMVMSLFGGRQTPSPDEISKLRAFLNGFEKGRKR